MTAIAEITRLPIVTQVRVDDWPEGKQSQFQVQLVGNGLGQIIHVPVIVARGTRPGPCLGVTAAIHGDELNGIGLIHRLLYELRGRELSGTVIAVPVVNVPGYLREQRRYSDGRDLNRVMPGKEDGIPSEVYAFRFLERIACSFEYLVDLHTASAGRGNSFYVRANMHHETAAWMALAQFPDIVLNNEAKDSTLRGAMMDRGVPAITVELGNPQRLQRKMVRLGPEGVLNIMGHLGMIEHELKPSRRTRPVICTDMEWLHTRAGGLLRVYPDMGSRVKEGEVVARVDDIYGNKVEEYEAPYDGIVVGKSLNPVNPTGSRILSLGRVVPPRQLRKEFPLIFQGRTWKDLAPIEP